MLSGPGRRLGPRSDYLVRFIQGDRWGVRGVVRGVRSARDLFLKELAASKRFHLAGFFITKSERILGYGVRGQTELVES